MSSFVVCGGRDYFRRHRVFQILDAAVERLGLTELASGLAAGADTDARLWAEARGVPFTGFKADWNLYGRGAGIIRNRVMLAEFAPEVVIAFPGGRGTADCVSRAQGMGIRVIKVDWQ